MSRSDRQRGDPEVARKRHDRHGHDRAEQQVPETGDDHEASPDRQPLDPDVERRPRIAPTTTRVARGQPEHEPGSRNPDPDRTRDEAPPACFEVASRDRGQRRKVLAQVPSHTT